MCRFAVKKLLTHSLIHAKSTACSIKLRAYFTFIYVCCQIQKTWLYKFFLSCCARFLPAWHYTTAGSNYGRVSVCLSVNLTVTSRCFIRTDERISVFLAWSLLSTSATVCFLWKIRYLQNKSTFIRHFFPNSGPQHIDGRTSRKVDAQSVINWTVVGHYVDNTSEHRRSTAVVYRRDRREALSTAWFRRAGPSATRN